MKKVIPNICLVPWIDFQLIAPGTLGQLGAIVQKHVAQVARLAQGPKMGHFMVEAIARDHYPNQLLAIQIAALVGVNQLHLPSQMPRMTGKVIVDLFNNYL